MRKGAYSYEHIDNWKNVNKKSRNIITWTENDFYSHLNMKDITDADYIDAKRICKDIEIKKKKWKKSWFVCAKWYIIVSWYNKYTSLILQNYFSAPGLAWQAALKKAKVKLDVLTDIDILLMVEKGIKRGIRHCTYQYAKASNKYMKDYDKNK